MTDQKVAADFQTVALPMRWQTPESNIAKFLRAALAEQARAVTELEASARAAGLLGEAQSITDAKAFKLAKKFLRIRSVRVGFGPRSQWLWELPRENTPSAKAEPQAAPAHRIPSDWIEGLASLDADRPLADVPRLRWRQFVSDCHNFLSPSH